MIEPKTRSLIPLDNSIILPGEELNVFSRSHFFSRSCFVGGIRAGSTVADIVEALYARGGIHPLLRQGAEVTINGEIVPVDMWRFVRPRPGANIDVSVPLHGGGGGGGGGGKNPLKMVLSLVVAVAVMVVAPMVLGPLLGAGGTIFGTTVGGFGLTGLSLNIGIALGTGIISMAAAAAINAVFPTSAPSLGRGFSGLGGGSGAGSVGVKESPTYSISGARNSSRVFSPVPVVLGAHKCVPPLGAKVYTEVLGDDEYLRMLFIWGIGPLKIEDLKIGETPISSYTDIEIETREGRVGDAPITLIPDIVLQDSIGVALTSAAGAIVRRTKEDADEISVDIVLPGGLVKFSGLDRTATSVSVTVEYQLVGAGGWTSAPSFSLSDQTNTALRKGLRWSVSKGQYDVRLKRTTADSTDIQVHDTVSWTYLRTIRHKPPTNFPVPLAMTAIRIKATDQLQGVIDNLSGKVSSYAPDWDGSAWVESITQNPASLLRLALTGPGSARPRLTTQLDDVSFRAFHTFCATSGYKANMVRDYSSSMWGVFSDLCSTSRAAITVNGGKWAVIMDDFTKPIVQHFTPRNSWGFGSEKVIMIPPHGWRVRFVDEDNGYEQEERIVYDDGYNVDNATLFEGIEFPGVTNRDLVWKLARYHIAQARLRPESITFNADFENLVCQRGDRIVVSHDVMLIGLGSGRVKSLLVDGLNTTGVVLDDKITMETGKAYACRFRTETGTSILLNLVLSVGESSTLTFTTPQVTATGPAVGDLAMFGISGSETADFIVKGIVPGQDLTATLVCVDYAPDIALADSGTIPAYTPNITQQADITGIAPEVPVIYSVNSGVGALVLSPGGVQSRILVGISPVSGNVRASKIRGRFRVVGSSSWVFVESPIEQSVLTLIPVTEGAQYEIQAQAVSYYGVASPWSSITHETVIGQSEPPANVTGFACNILGAQANLSWSANTEIDFSHYRIRWSPLLSGASWASSVDSVARVSSTSISIPSVAGTFLIKAVDYQGNESVTAASAITSITAVQGLNFVASISQSTPSWVGTGSDTYYDAALGGIALSYTGNIYDVVNIYPELITPAVYDPGISNIYDVANIYAEPRINDILVSAAIYSGGLTNVYNYGSMAASGTFPLGSHDNGSVVTTRVSGSLSVFGVNLTSDIYSFANIYDVGDLRAVADGSYSAGLEIRTTNDDPLGTPTWSSWVSLQVGDYTSRAFEARLTLTGLPPDITPVVSSATVSLDMEDRVVGFSSVVGTGGATITYSPAFFVTPKIGIAVSNGVEGDSYTITSETPSGFHIAFTNTGSPVSRTLTGVAHAYGAVA
ncbi:Tip attachment protein J [uncultured Caudovirales phage]|uniref:Tip attachment protein J n=1 Tax=uncultured Caudovirales phage TaxID=2100421 RepID=A0A6J5RIV0_9CAUD|nr:Tip attachment protein J [uncultured Caudovirales phage]